MNHLGALIGSNEVTGIGLIVMDIDYFKNINDTYGYSVGDEVIKVVSTVLSDNISNQDTIGRIGGEEFLIVMPGVVVEEAYDTTENLRASIEALSWDHVDMKVTISGGVYCKQYSESLDELLEKVDQQLYASKNKGRNQISCC